MPSYVKFMKDILSNKKRLGEFKTVALTKGCSAFLQNKLPSKMKDPRCFTVPCNIGESYCGKPLCDLRASINLIAMFVFKILGIGDVRPITVTFQLADRSLTYSKGKIKDVLVCVDKLSFMNDFIILDFDADKEVLIILGRPFLAIWRTLIDVEKGELTIRVQDDQVTINFLKAMKFPDSQEEYSTIEELDPKSLQNGNAVLEKTYWKTA
ncbi:uncharacterized protein LOC108459021 [Gossypium arboreum]|uniref:uncharacterized protein LOC108459021 n=1 Tax=Gossypium arboreum TaxID=29729 RepID=UPI00081909D9|nr:uncharacterized protein LOC108459021 [Gossypium arboreum]